MPTKSTKVETYERTAGLVAQLTAHNAAQNADEDMECATPGWIAQRAVELLRLADRLQHYAEAACNYSLTPAQEKRVATLEARVLAICAELGLRVTFNGDPRGYAVKLHLPSGHYNTWGGREEGWGI